MRNKRGETTTPQSMKSLVSEQSQASILADMDPEHSPPALRQQPHVSTNMFGFMPGDRVIVPKIPVQRIAVADFPKQWIVPGSHVITRAAPSSPWARMCVKLQGVDFWVWRVLSVIQPTSASSSSDKKHSDVRYIAQVYHPAHRSKPKDVWYPTWQHKGPLYLRTTEELAEGRLKKTHRLKRLSLKSKKSRKSKTSTQMKKAADKAQKSLKQEPHHNVSAACQHCRGRVSNDWCWKDTQIRAVVLGTGQT